jgi:ATP-dependent Clp protease ATP-binding subunit ClpC
MVSSVAKRLSDMNINITVSDKAKDYLSKQGFDPQYGARPLKRAIQRMLEDKLSEEILAGNVVLGDSVQVDADDNGLTFNNK